jgi:micrococcal nuclease
LVPLNSFAQSSAEIPEWIRNNTKWWAASQISDNDFAKGLEYLIQKEILKVSQTTNIDSNSSEQIPSWLRNNADWWSKGLLSDDEFVKGIQYLVSNGIIRVSQNNSSCLGDGLCISARVDKIVDGDTIYIEGYKIRLSLANTPERNEKGFLEATEFTKKLCPVGSTVVVDQDDRQPYDDYDRLLGKVHCGDKVLNSELLYNGYANILTQYCSTSEFSGETWAQRYGCATNNQESKPEITKENSKPISVKENQCDPSYPDVCILPYPPDLDCKDVSYRNFKVLPPDPHRFDGNKDGIGCEGK